MTAAVEVYNKFDFPYRLESFASLAINAWELLLKARWLAKHRNRPQFLYVYQRKRKKNGELSVRKYIKRTRSNQPFTIGMVDLSRRMVENNELDRLAYRNLVVLSELRDCAIHFYEPSEIFESRLYEVSAACVKNYCVALDMWFEIDLGGRDPWLMPLAFVLLPRSVDAVVGSTVEKQFLQFIERQIEMKETVDSTYSVAVNVDIRLNRSNSFGAAKARLTNEVGAVAVRLDEEQIGDRYPWDYKQLYRECMERYSDFKVDSKFHAARQTLEGDKRFAWLRYLNPANSSGTKKILYSPNILQAFDRVYTRV